MNINNMVAYKNIIIGKKFSISVENNGIII